MKSKSLIKLSEIDWYRKNYFEQIIPSLLSTENKKLKNTINGFKYSK